MAEKQPKSAHHYVLAEQDIVVHSLCQPAIHVHTNLNAGAFKCRRNTKAEAEACCAQYEHAGSVYRDTDSLDYGCAVDKGTGDWD